MSESLRRNPPLLCAFRALYMALFPVAIITLFYKHEIGLSMAEIMLLQGIFGVSMAILEFPSGYVADRVGYRNSLLAASILAVLGWTIYSLASTFLQLALAEIILALPAALISGCDSALLYESLLADDDEESFRRWDGRVRFWAQTSEGTAALSAGVLFAMSARLPFWLQTGVMMLAAGVAYAMREPKRERAPQPDSHVAHAGAMIRYALITNKRLASLFFLSVALSLCSFIPVWLVPIYATDSGLADEWVGPLWAAANYVVAAGAITSDRAVNRLGLLPTVLAGIALTGLGYVGMGLAGSFLGAGYYFCITFTRGLVGPAVLHEEQKLLPSSDRAGFLSLRSLVFRLSFFVIGPSLGVLIDQHGMRPVLLGCAPVLVVVCLLGCLWLARNPQADRGRSKQMQRTSF